MPDAQLIQPDTAFIREVMASGGADLKKCFQCATCSTVCTLAPEEAPFPRRQMVLAQWGLKDRLVGDPAIWLCHNCGDCTTHCPRGARPGDVFGALRSQAIAYYAWPGVLGRMGLSPAALVALLLLPVLIFGAIALWAPRDAHARPMEFSAVFPIPTLEVLFFTVAGFVIGAFLVGLVRFARDLRRAGADAGILANLGPALIEILAHRRLAKCATEKTRRWGHLLTLWGFAGLAVMGTLVGLGSMFGLLRTPLALTDPFKIFGNVSAAVTFAGCALLLADRLASPAKRAGSSSFDWFFLVLLSSVVFTGILTELVRLIEAASVMYAVYFVHLVLIFALFVGAPCTKFAHLGYRTVAMAATARTSRFATARMAPVD